MKRNAFTLVELLVVIPIAFIVLSLFVEWMLPLEAMIHMVSGWISFPWRMVSQLDVSVFSVVMAVVMLVLFVIGFQRLATWWGNSIDEQGEWRATRPWKWRWTFVVTAVILLSFTAGFAVMGAACEFVWTVSSPEPLFSYRERPSWRTRSKNNLKQIGLALHNYHDVAERFPEGGTFNELGRPLVGWQTTLLPFLGHAPLYNQIDFDVPWDSPENVQVYATVLPEYLILEVQGLPASDDAGRALTHYSGNGRVFNSQAGMTISAIADGTSETLLAGEVIDRLKPWGHPVNWRDPALGINRTAEGFGGPWDGGGEGLGGAQFILGDGSVRFISENIDQNVLNALATPDGGEAVSQDW